MFLSSFSIHSSIHRSRLSETALLYVAYSEHCAAALTPAGGRRFCSIIFSTPHFLQKNNNMGNEPM